MHEHKSCLRATVIVVCLAIGLVARPTAAQNVVINEIMYHPSSENDLEEFIELYNRGPLAVNVGGWHLSDGVDYDFPPITLAAGAYLVVAADVDTFLMKYPGVVNVIGNWNGQLSNKGEAVELTDATDARIDWVPYADEGEWAGREEGPNDLGHRGWIWSDAHDGGGKSLALMNSALPNEYGQNWAASWVDQGTPGAANLVATTDIAPMIVDVNRVPILPRSSDSSTVTARIIDESPAAITATLHYRVDGAATFATMAMLDNGLNGDGAAGDGVYGAVLAPRSNGTVIEYFIEARDAANSRTLPAPSLVGGTPRQVTNFLYLVDDTNVTSTILPRGSVWRYLDDGSNQGTAWQAPGFNDAGWSMGPAQLGYGDGDESTTVSFGPDPNNKYITTYFRCAFHVADTSRITGLTVRLLRDDGAVVYLNGAYAFRDNMPGGAIDFQTLAPPPAVGGADEDTYFVHSVNPAMLTVGTNVLAVEIHQQAVTSGDISFDLELAAVIPGTAGDLWTSGSQPIYHIVMTDAERAELADIGAGGGDQDSDAQMNATFISIDAAGVQARYNVGVRNRGHGSRDDPPMNYRVNFRNDQPWSNLRAVNINSKYTHSQVAGSAIFQQAGIQPARAQPVQVRVNGQDLAEPALRMFGSYAAKEAFDADYVDSHFPHNNGGNFYMAFRLDSGLEEANLRYEGPDPDAYRNTYFKHTNEEEDDWSDLIRLTYALNNAPDATYYQAVARVVDIEQWVRYLALDSLLQNWETGLVRGIGDDYGIYRGVKDPRFVLVPHDLDTLLGQGNSSGNINHSIFTFRQLPGLSRFLYHRDIVPLYYRAFFDLTETIYRPEALDPLLDDVLGGFAPQGTINAMKQYAVNRTAAVLAQIPQAFTINCDLPVVNGYPCATTPFAALYGNAHAAYTRSVLVNGRPAEWDPVRGEWRIGQTTGGSAQILLSRGSEWRYLDDGSDQGTSWSQPGFNDTGWVLGRAQLGYGDGDENTVVWYGPDANNKFITTYFRCSFSVPDTSDIVGLTLRLVRDDGAVVYLNGSEVERPNMPATGPINFQTLALPPAVGGADEDTFFEYPVNPALLVNGPNVLAVEIHQVNGQSSDISFDLELEAQTTGGAPDTGVSLYPGINRVFVEAFEGPNGTGNVYQSGYIDIWYDGLGVAAAEGLRLQVRRTYLPGVPILVRAEALDQTGAIDRDVWDAVVTLSTDRSDVSLSPNQISLYNGLGSALVSIAGSGDFTLTATLGGQGGTPLQVSRALVSLEGVPMTGVAGTLSGTSTTWAGIVHVTGDLLVPAGHTLSVLPGTLVLLDGIVSGETGTDIDVQGTIQSLGTALDPVTFTAFDPTLAWGEIHHDNADPSLYQYTHITRAGNSPRGGHTNTGPIVRPNNSAITFDHVNLTDAVGKVMQASGSDLTFFDCHLARSIMGPEIASTALLLERSWITEMYGPDDDDGIYIHSQLAGQTCVMRGGVIADTDDDGLDTLGSIVDVEDYVIRDIFDKGASVFGGVTTLNRVLLVGNGFGVSAKEQGTGHSIVNMDHATVVNNGVGFQSYDKTGEPNAWNEYFVANSIIWDNADAVYTDYDPNDIHIDYCDVGETWTTGTGILNADPLFAAPANHNYHLRTGSPCIDTGDPAAPLDPDGTRTDMGYYLTVQDLGTSHSGTLTSDTIFIPEEGPYYIWGDLIVPVGVTLTIRPGTTLFFYPGTRVLVYGRLVAEGAQYGQVRFTRVPGMAAWGGIQFLATTEDNRITYSVIEYAVTNNGMVHVENANLLIDHVTFDHTDRRRIWTQDSSLIVRNSHFVDIFGPAQPPTLDNLNEHIWGGGIPAGGHFIIENNIFGITKGHNDAIDFDNAQRPGPIPQILNNRFMGGGDDALDLEADAHIEGNIFLSFHKDVWNVDPGESNVISAGGGYHYVVVRNVFYDFDHAVLAKDNSFLTFENNSAVNGTLGTIYFDVPGQTLGPGRGAYVEGSIFQNTPLIFDEVLTTTDLTVNQSVVTTDLLGLGVGNTDADPLLADPANGDFSLLPGSPAIGTGPNGLDMGALVPAGASISGEPPAFTTSRNATLIIDGPGITHYRFSLDGGPYGLETLIDTPVQLTGLGDGDHVVTVIGKNSASVWQAEANAARSKTWTVNPSHTSLKVTEVMYNPLWGSEYEFLELHNVSSSSTVNLGSMAFTNGITYTFPNGAALAPNAYALVVGATPKNNYANFRRHYGLDDSVALFGSYGGKLANSGERVTLQTNLAEVVFSFEYDDARGWPIAADGAGHSLVPLDTVVQPPVSLDYGGNWRFSTYIYGSPGTADPVLPPTVVLNEVTANTNFSNPGYPAHDTNDWLELFNASSSPVNLTDWYLSDNNEDLRKWAIFTTATIPAGGRLDLDEITAFHDPLTTGFGLSKDGERAYLSYLPGTIDDRVVDAVRFKGQEQGVSLSRYPDGGAYWYATAPTLDASNAVPNADVVISEFNYNPGDHSIFSEFIELHNPTAQTVNLWNATGPWRLDGTDFVFPPGTSLGAGGYLLVVNFDPAIPAALDAFKGAYGLTDLTVPVFGPFSGNLSDKGERIAVERPQPPARSIMPPAWVIVDEVIYFDRAPWTPAADGLGPSLHRIASDRSGRDPTNWTAAMPSPGDGSIVVTGYALTISAVNGWVQKVPDQVLYAPGAFVMLGAMPAVGYHFVNWTGDVPPNHETDNPLTLTMDGHKSLTANFAINAYSLTVAATNGSVQKTPDQPTYQHGALVTLTATANPGYRFANWTGDVPPGHATDNPLALTMDAAKSLTAIFTPDEPSTRASDYWTLYR